MGVTDGGGVVTKIVTTVHKTFIDKTGKGAYSFSLPNSPDGHINLVMLSPYERILPYGSTYHYVWNFFRKCKELGKIVYIFTPIPLPAEEE